VVVQEKGEGLSEWLRWMVPRLPRLVAQFVRATVSQRGRVGRSALEFHARRVHRWSIVGGNLRIQRLLDAMLRPGDHFVDVGANIGYNALYAAARVGSSGRVTAIEPTPDTLSLLRAHIAGNQLHNVKVVAAAAGRRRETRRLFVRGAVSGVNSLYPDGCYGEPTSVAAVEVHPLDDVVSRADVVKIDVEGAEIEVLEGMTGLIAQHHPIVIAEWHPALQQAAGFEPTALPRWLLGRGYQLGLAWHTRFVPFDEDQMAAVARALLARRRSVELVATWGAASRLRVVPAPRVATRLAHGVDGRALDAQH
jgi:FkbM family methyltransferase